MKEVLISIQPKWCELIASGKKTVEIRKKKPNIETPFKCYIYATKSVALWKIRKRPILIVPTYDNRQYVAENEYYSFDEVQGKIIGEFVCDKIFPIRVFENGSIQDYMWHSMERSCVPYDDISLYIGKDKTGYGWHISNLVIYDKPKELSEFRLCGVNKMWSTTKKLERPPQSWCYIKKER